MASAKIDKASAGLVMNGASPPSTATSSPKLSAMFENVRVMLLTRERVAAFAVMRNQAFGLPQARQRITVNVGLGCPST